MEWQVFGVIAALCGFAGAIIAPAVKLNASITRLTVTMEHLVRELDAYKESSREEHERLWKKNSEQDRMLIGHEGRMAALEQRPVS